MFTGEEIDLCQVACLIGSDDTPELVLVADDGIVWSGDNLRKCVNELLNVTAFAASTAVLS